MRLEEIELILKMLNEGHDENAKAILRAERDRLLYLKNQHNEILVQEAFNKYAEEIALFDNSKWSNLYSYVDSLFTFTNGISIYRLRKHLTILEEMKKAMRKDSNDVLLLKEAEIKEIDGMFDRCEMLLGDNKLLVEFENRSVENQITTYESGPVCHAFSMKQIDYMDTFLGKDAKVYMSDKNPIAYAESDKGTGYVLGIKR